ncbi:methylmalonyl-CoA mutase family protein [Bacillus kwashiorkori]|uniref:methylmalonyl-CoA mutase family protein n=1 Tax=Bacillus kwashiorkori TaxID=1522318 RepID=UPI00078343F9|nr:methylmalonyl-CoA mutase family protein [Bacillus kwashiorkori]
MEKQIITMDHVKNETFAEKTYEEWLKEAEKSLKGKTVSAYYSETAENIKIKPLYTKNDIEKTTYEALTNFSIKLSTEYIKNEQHLWKISQKVSGETLQEINDDLKQALHAGQNTIYIPLLDSLNVETLQTLLDGVDVEQYPFFIEEKEIAAPFYLMLSEWVDKNGVDASAITGLIGSDPFTYMIDNKIGSDECDIYYSYWWDAITYASDRFPNLDTIFIDSRYYGNAGANAIIQLAVAISTAVAHIDHLQLSGLHAKEILPKVVLGLSVGSNFFMEIAKIRAAKVLWTKIRDAYEIKEDLPPLQIFAETSSVNETNLDLHVNLLRKGNEALAAAIAKVDYLRIHPFSQLSGVQYKLSQRLALNMHHILREEAKIAQVYDPANGAYFIESLTSELIEKAWSFIMMIEKQGGLLEAIKKGYIQDLIKKDQQRLVHQLNTQKNKLVGVNKYVNLEENLDFLPSSTEEVHYENPFVHQIYPLAEVQDMVRDGFTLKEFMYESYIEPDTVDSFTQLRLAKSFEILRKRSHQLAKRGKTPTIPIVCLEEYQSIKGKIDFITDFFAAGGIRSDIIGKTADSSKIFRENINHFVCLCGTNKHYSDFANSYLPKLKEEYPHIQLILVGELDENLIEQYKQYDVKYFIYRDVNQLVILEELLDIMELDFDLMSDTNNPSK